MFLKKILNVFEISWNLQEADIWLWQFAWQFDCGSVLTRACKNICRARRTLNSAQNPYSGNVYKTRTTKFNHDLQNEAEILFKLHALPQNERNKVEFLEGSKTNFVTNSTSFFTKTTFSILLNFLFPFACLNSAFSTSQQEILLLKTTVRWTRIAGKFSSKAYYGRLKSL